MKISSAPSRLRFRIWLSCATLLIAALSGCGYHPGDVPRVPLSQELNSTSVFMGDSITHLWPLPIHNQGISSQTTYQMLSRFRADVLGHNYARVIILGGTNDLLHTTEQQSEITTNLEAMAEIAQTAGIEVVLCQLPPLQSQGVDYNSRVRTLNAAIRQLASAHGYLAVDYFTPLYGQDGMFKDGIHPTAAGYALMETALATVVTK